jgi:hypothetical protein
MMRMLLRITKGRALMQAFDYIPEQDIFTRQKIDEEQVAEKRSKSIFVILYQSSAENILMSKIIKICELFNTSRFKIPNINEYEDSLKELTSNIREQERYLKESRSSSINFIKLRAGTVSLFSII